MDKSRRNFMKTLAAGAAVAAVPAAAGAEKADWFKMEGPVPDIAGSIGTVNDGGSIKFYAGTVGDTSKLLAEGSLEFAVGNDGVMTGELAEDAQFVADRTETIDACYAVYDCPISGEERYMNVDLWPYYNGESAQLCPGDIIDLSAHIKLE